MSNQLLIELLEEFKDKMDDFDGSFVRETNLPKITNKIKVIIGMRRTGKTYFVHQVIYQLLNNNTPLKRILYFNFEDDRLTPCTRQNLRKLVDEFYTLYPDNHKEICYFFFDEIQNVEDWPILMRRYFDTKKIQLFLTGSSSKLLSKEIATSLRGRSIPIEIWPFSFREYLTAKRISLPTPPLGKRVLDEYKMHLLNYLNQGGFPETLHYDISDRFQLLQDYVNVVIFKDIVERHQITNIILVKYIIKTLIKNAGSTFTVNKFYNDLKSQGFSVAKNTIHEYLGYIEDVNLTFSISLYSESIRKIQTNPKKIYIIDTGLINAYTISRQKNTGHLFENLIYLDLRRKKHEIYYYLTENRHEVDFLTKDLIGKWHLYQVVWDINDQHTLERETRALQEAEQELKIKGTIITPEYYLSSWVTSL